ncbi:DUF4158 domain-containing protein [Nonomuraea deserti]|uniref:DUF4158 domain-containing protein n=1 Tax=Nonomuraea deserti TaxID=1848322 RepID=A0A4R4WF76_9ACTN|nr:DUF4158 domain-containing protein [Nonomuraea deserti]
MPVEFLSDDEAVAYGRYVEAPTRAELEKMFFLDHADRKLIGRRRGDQTGSGSPPSTLPPTSACRTSGLTPEDPAPPARLRMYRAAPRVAGLSGHPPRWGPGQDGWSGGAGGEGCSHRDARHLLHAG